MPRPLAAEPIFCCKTPAHVLMGGGFSGITRNHRESSCNSPLFRLKLGGGNINCGRPRGVPAPHGPVRVNAALSTAIIDCAMGLLYPFPALFSRPGSRGIIGCVFALIFQGGVELPTRHRLLCFRRTPRAGALPPPFGALSENGGTRRGGGRPAPPRAC